MLGLGLGLSRGGFVSQPLLLDTYSGAAAAYSLRKLRTAYTGAAIRVRESATNTEADIGFNADGTLNTTALLAHTGANDGFVVTWYDQSENARDFTQTTAANQPQIVSSGSVLTLGGKPTIKPIQGTNTPSLEASFVGAATSTAFFVYNFITSTTPRITIGGQTTADFFIVSDSNATSTAIQNVGTPSFYKDNVLQTFSQRNQVDAALSGGQSLLSGIDLNLSTWTQIRLKYNDNGFLPYNDFQEVIIYASDESATRTAIESNINDYYNIYP